MDRLLFCYLWPMCSMFFIKGKFIQPKLRPHASTDILRKSLRLFQEDRQDLPQPPGFWAKWGHRELGRCLEAPGQSKGRLVFTMRAGSRTAFVCSGPLFIFKSAWSLWPQFEVKGQEERSFLFLFLKIVLNFFSGTLFWSRSFPSSTSLSIQFHILSTHTYWFF